MEELVTKGGTTKAIAHGMAVPDTPQETIDEYLRTLKDHQREWATYPITGRIKLLEQVQANIVEYLDQWAQEDLKARHIPEGHPETLVSFRSPGLVGIANRNYLETLKQIKSNGGYRPYVKARQRGNRVIIDSFPKNFTDKLVYHGVRAEIWLKSGTKLKDLPSYQASSYKTKDDIGGISFISAAGNVSAAVFADLYQKLIMEKHVCIIKTHPVLEYMGDILSKVLAPFIEAGFVRIVTGGTSVGKYLSEHPLVRDIAFTGSDKTFDAIVYGLGDEGQINKQKDLRLNDKPIACELGNITPVIVVPGDWTETELDYQAKNIFLMLANNNGYACVAARMLVLPKKWDKSAILLQKLEDMFINSVQPVNYYPGTEETFKDAKQIYPEADVFGNINKEQQPFIFAKNLNANKNEIAFRREFWATFMGQTYINGKDDGEYLANAVKFANEKLWGTLAAVIIIDPKTQKELTQNGTFQRAIEDLQYGTIVTNAYPGLSLTLGTNPWGGYPGSSYQDIQSGNTFTLNPFLLDNIEKSVVYAPFCKLPLPSWKPSHKALPQLARAFTMYLIQGGFTAFLRLARARRKMMKQLK